MTSNNTDLISRILNLKLIKKPITKAHYVIVFHSESFDWLILPLNWLSIVNIETQLPL